MKKQAFIACFFYGVLYVPGHSAGMVLITWCQLVGECYFSKLTNCFFDQASLGLM
jgi:hypothetical protein